ncbi:MAG: M48 family metallopeptidase [Alistipes sp.]|nr:M48 family metallopeptidase [Alistipes sp.]
MKLRDETIDIEGIGPVRVVQSARARRVTLSVRPSGDVRLSYPRGTSRERALAFLGSRTEWIAAARERMTRRAEARPRIEYTPEQVEALRRAAKADLPARTAAIAARLGLKYGRVTIRAARTKWGSCTGDDNLSLSLFMMTLPEHLRDYVIVHELCHTVHHNHSARFHALVDRCLGGRERELDRELKTYRIR